MKENPDIDELLNSFIDGEASAREQTEVHRLLSHDKQVARRLAELQKCKILVDSLPRAEAPAEMTDRIKAALQATAPLAQQPVRFDKREGVRGLLIRRVVAAAAMIGLIAVLATVVYTIVAPETMPEKLIVAKDSRQPAGKVELAAAGKSTAPAKEPAGGGFNGRLELKTDALIAVNAFINRAIEDNGYCVYSKTQADKGVCVYRLSCSREGVNLLLADLNTIWARFDSASLFVETGTIGQKIKVDAVSPVQVAEIVTQEVSQKCVEVAKDFAVLNSIAGLLPGKEILAAIDDRGRDLMTIPKPVLTSGEKVTGKPAGAMKDGVEISLTIVVAPSK